MQQVSQKTHFLQDQQTNDGKNYLSVYQDHLTPEFLSNQIAKVLKCFPAIEDVYYFEVLKQRFIEKGFTNNRVKDAINHVIDTCVYPKPAMAEFLSFDKKIKLLTYEQYCQLGINSQYYKSVRINGLNHAMWANIDDIKMYNLELWKK